MQFETRHDIIQTLVVTHPGLVDGAVQCIVFLVVQEAEVKGPQCSCEHTGKAQRRRSRSMRNREAKERIIRVWMRRPIATSCFLLLAVRSVYFNAR
jgi:hypothetical protein